MTTLYDRKLHKELPYPMSPYEQHQDDEGFGFEINAPVYIKCEVCGGYGPIMAERIVEAHRDPTVVYKIDPDFCGHWTI